jgi:hypothetical protein
MEMNFASTSRLRPLLKPCLCAAERTDRETARLSGAEEGLQIARRQIVKAWPRSQSRVASSWKSTVENRTSFVLFVKTSAVLFERLVFSIEFEKRKFDFLRNENLISF